ncbi:unnamed protein product [Schistosoma rodhaini]|nr:unnamed protein product [Schistosoma rodhaini]
MKGQILSTNQDLEDNEKRNEERLAKKGGLGASKVKADFSAIVSAAEHADVEMKGQILSTNQDLEDNEKRNEERLAKKGGLGASKVKADFSAIVSAAEHADVEMKGQILSTNQDLEDNEKRNEERLAKKGGLGASKVKADFSAIVSAAEHADVEMKGQILSTNQDLEDNEKRNEERLCLHRFHSLEYWRIPCKGNRFAQSS